ncbi:hypothetical protein [Bartonella sp. ML70XJBT]|uniref:hypothetical protein n=1 Tax=Bartonella sp. ML70XJBT TaxID=3019096 RepID=UPI00236096E7|nr:hypothetical protein [Bartonella sp. ML70XJBT]
MFRSFSYSFSNGWSHVSNTWSNISSMNFSSSGSRPGCTVGDYLSTANSYGLTGYHLGQTGGVFVGSIVGALPGGSGIIPGAVAGGGIGGGLGYGAGGLIGIGSQYNACY